MSKENSTPQGGPADIVAHFSAHCDAVVALNFDQSGLMLVTADKNGHRFNVFKIHPNVLGSSFAAVHHLYTLHRYKNNNNATRPPPVRTRAKKKKKQKQQHLEKRGKRHNGPTKKKKIKNK